MMGAIGIAFERSQQAGVMVIMVLYRFQTLIHWLRCADKMIELISISSFRFCPIFYFSFQQDRSEEHKTFDSLIRSSGSNEHVDVANLGNFTLNFKPFL